MPISVHAAGLGRISVLSPLGQPLNAEIEIVALRPGEEDTLSARVAPLEAFEAAGIEPSAVLSTVRFAIERRDSRRIVRVTTSQPVNEPFVELLVELQWHNGRLVREYTFLLDPPEYKARDALAAAPVQRPPKPTAEVEAKPVEPAAPTPPPLAVAPAPAPAAESEKPAPAVEPEKPSADAQPEKPAVGVEVAKEPAKEDSPALLADEPGVYEVMQGDTLGKIARGKLPPGITLNQMLVAIYRANQDAFIRENLNLVRAGRILNIPGSDAIGTVDVKEANRVVRAHMAEFREYRGRLAAAPAVADAASGQREAAGQIEAKPQAPKAAAEDQVRLSKVDPQKPSVAAAAAARGDDLAAQDRALKEAQSRISDLEKNVADLQKLLELKNQQLAELEKRSGAKPAAAASAPAPASSATGSEAPQPAAPAAAPSSVAQAPEKPAPAGQAPLASQPPASAQAVKPAPKKVAPLPPEPSLLDELVENPVTLAGLVGVVVLLAGYAAWAWRKKKTAQVRFQDSVIGAAAAGAAAGASVSELSISGAAPATSPVSGGPPPAAMAGEEVDPIAEADVYMAYGRDAQAEEILKEALQKDARRVAVYTKLLEIYARRKDTKAFEQSAAKLKNLTGGSGPDWEKAAALGKSIDPGNGLYAGAAAAAAAAAAAEVSGPTPSPALDFDVGSVTQQVPAPDFTLDLPTPKGAANTTLDFDLSGSTAKKDVFTEDTVVPAGAVDKHTGIDFDFDLGTPAASGAKPQPVATAPAADPGLTFDLDLDLGEKKTEPAPAAATATDFSTISLDLGSAGSASAAGTDPKWQEIATKLDLAKAYEEMGDKDGARELLNEVMKDGDSAQKGQAQQLLVKLG
ncbi:MAG TPA: FimV/HubP family polar landmark protein [Burkholderiales bacterium]|nr:FimV/HubP family polar landmark protein [Burkholderiales bacterium]